MIKSSLHPLIKHPQATYPSRGARNQAPDQDRVAERALYQIASYPDVILTIRNLNNVVFSETPEPEPSIVGIIIPPTVPGTQITTGPTFPERNAVLQIRDYFSYHILEPGSQSRIQQQQQREGKSQLIICFAFSSSHKFL